MPNPCSSGFKHRFMSVFKLHLAGGLDALDECKEHNQPRHEETQQQRPAH